MTEILHMIGTEGLVVTSKIATDLVKWDTDVVEASLGDEERLVLDAKYLADLNCLELTVADGRSQELIGLLSLWRLIPRAE